MKATFVVYDNFTSENLEEPKEYYLPVLLKNSHWNLKVNLDETFWYRAIYDLLSSDDKKLYCIFSFVDTKNGQNSIRVQEVKKEYIMKNEQILKYEDFISPSIINCNSLQACENGSNVTLNYEENFMNMHYEFLSSADENSFAMCFYNYHSKPLNLGKYNLDTTYIEFSAVSDNKCELKLEFKMSNDVNCAKILELNEEPQTIKIPTGIKIEMPKGVFALGVPRSSYGFKYRMALDNTCMIGDSDFYNNPTNEGHYMAKFTNHGDKTMEVNAGDAYMQCLLLPYLLTDDDEVTENRTGGIGSTGN